MFRLLMASVLVTVFVCEVDARPRRRRCVNCNNPSATMTAPSSTRMASSYVTPITGTTAGTNVSTSPGTTTATTAAATPLATGLPQTSSQLAMGSAPSVASGPQSVAMAKAQQAASRGIKGHVGGGFGGGNAEGVGFSSYSPQNALNNCCFTGQRQVAGQAVVRGRDGWYAVKIYW